MSPARLYMKYADVGLRVDHMPRLLLHGWSRGSRRSCRQADNKIRSSTQATGSVIFVGSLDQ